MAVIVRVCSHWNVKLLLCLLAIISAATIVLYLSGLTTASEKRENLRQTYKNEPVMEAMDLDFPDNFEPVFPERLVHLDLKGAPPKVEYLEELFPLLSKLGATGLLIEYEDMFPYWGPLEIISAKNAYSQETVAKINKLAKENNLEIIPLIQTFGHLEFALKGAEHSHLREVPEQPQAICPTNNESLPLLFHMLEQMVKLHPSSKRIHIGADEVYFIGKCDACRHRMDQKMWSTSDLFIDHVSTVAKFVADKLKKRPMMWDDEFRSFSEHQLIQSGIGSLVDIVVWNYQPIHQLGRDVWNKYLNVFNSIWAASAFKGATGSDQYLTNIRYHLENHRSWIELVSEYRGTAHYSKFKGIMITGWQRYDHFAVLCELLPVALPSLACDLLLLQHGNIRQVEEEAARLLNCNFGSSIITGSYSPQCRYPGSEVFRALENFSHVKSQYEKLLNDSVIRGWLTDYNIALRFSGQTHLERIGNELGYMQNTLDGFRRECSKALDLVYDRHTTHEWLETYVKPMQNKIDQLIQAIESLRSVSVWPRRPLQP